MEGLLSILTLKFLLTIAFAAACAALFFVRRQDPDTCPLLDARSSGDYSFHPPSDGQQIGRQVWDGNYELVLDRVVLDRFV
jgi:hypothetical protein